MIQNHLAEGLEPPALLVHPDDIVFTESGELRFLGPTCKASAKRTDETRQMRDVLIIQDAWDLRNLCKQRRDKAERKIGTKRPRKGPKPGTVALCFAMILDRSLPPRLRLKDNEWTMRMSHYDSVPKRELVKMLRKAWQTLGVTVKRGQSLPSLGAVEEMMTAIYDIIDQSRDTIDTDADRLVAEIIEASHVVRTQ